MPVWEKAMSYGAVSTSLESADEIADARELNGQQQER